MATSKRTHSASRRRPDPPPKGTRRRPAGARGTDGGLFARHRRDLWIVAIATIGALLALACWFDALGLVGRGADSALAHLIGGTAGVVVDLVILLAVAAAIYLRSRGTKVDHNNVNDDWTGTVAPAEPETAAAA